MELLKTGSGIATAEYADLMVLELPPGVSKVAIYLKEKNVNTVHYKVLGGMNGVDYPYEVIAESHLALNSWAVQVPSAVAALNDPMLWIKVQIKDDAGHGSVDGWMCGP